MPLLGRVRVLAMPSMDLPSYRGWFRCIPNTARTRFGGMRYCSYTAFMGHNRPTAGTDYFGLINLITSYRVMALRGPADYA